MPHNKLPVDGTRKRRSSPNKSKHDWYAHWRSLRFAKHMGFTSNTKQEKK